jgi:Tol biopolymer transport system component
MNMNGRNPIATRACRTSLTVSLIFIASCGVREHYEGFDADIASDSDADADADARPACAQHIAFHRADGLYVVRPDGTDYKSLVTGNQEENAVWSPDATRILFERGSGQDQQKDIWSVNVDGTGLTNLTMGATGNDRSPAWSPDGKHIAFLSRRDYVTGCCPEDLWIMDSDGRNPRKLDEKASAPDWSPDGSKIAYSSYKSGRFQVYVVSPDGTGSRNISNSSFTDNNPKWSSNGTKILFNGIRGGLGVETYIMNSDGTDQQNLAPTLGVSAAAVWSNDGMHIALHASMDMQQNDIFRINADRTGLRNLTPATGSNERNPYWSPDGKQLVFESDRDGNREIYRINDDGTGPLRLSVSEFFSESAPAWAPCR